VPGEDEPAEPLGLHHLSPEGARAWLEHVVGMEPVALGDLIRWMRKDGFDPDLVNGSMEGLRQFFSWFTDWHERGAPGLEEGLQHSLDQFFYRNRPDGAEDPMPQHQRQMAAMEPGAYLVNAVARANGAGGEWASTPPGRPGRVLARGDQSAEIARGANSFDAMTAFWLVAWRMLTASSSYRGLDQWMFVATASPVIHFDPPGATDFRLADLPHVDAPVDSPLRVVPNLWALGEMRAPVEVEPAYGEFAIADRGADVERGMRFATPFAHEPFAQILIEMGAEDSQGRAMDPAALVMGEKAQEDDGGPIRYAAFELGDVALVEAYSARGKLRFLKVEARLGPQSVFDELTRRFEAIAAELGLAVGPVDAFDGTGEYLD